MTAEAHTPKSQGLLEDTHGAVFTEYLTITATVDELLDRVRPPLQS